MAGEVGLDRASSLRSRGRRTLSRCTRSHGIVRARPGGRRRVDDLARDLPDSLTTDGAASMALILRGISLARSADPPHEPAEWLILCGCDHSLQRAGRAWPTDRDAAPDRTRSAWVPEIGSVVLDALQPAALRRRFPMLQVRPVGDNAVHVLFPGGDFVCVPEMDTPVLIGMLTLLEHDEAIILPGLSTDQFLLALAALDGLALLACPELELTEISPIQLVRQREELFAFVRRIRHDDDAAQSYEQLISLFLTEDARGSLAGLSPSLWGAAASVAIASWVARSGQSRSGRPVDLERLHDVTGQEPEAMGDEYRLLDSRAASSGLPRRAISRSDGAASSTHTDAW